MLNTHCDTLLQLRNQWVAVDLEDCASGISEIQLGCAQEAEQKKLHILCWKSDDSNNNFFLLRFTPPISHDEK